MARSSSRSTSSGGGQGRGNVSVGFGQAIQQRRVVGVAPDRRLQVGHRPGRRLGLVQRRLNQYCLSFRQAVREPSGLLQVLDGKSHGAHAIATHALSLPEVHVAQVRLRQGERRVRRNRASVRFDRPREIRLSAKHLAFEVGPERIRRTGCQTGEIDLRQISPVMEHDAQNLDRQPIVRRQAVGRPLRCRLAQQLTSADPVDVGNEHDGRLDHDSATDHGVVCPSRTSDIQGPRQIRGCGVRHVLVPPGQHRSCVDGPQSHCAVQTDG